MKKAIDLSNTSLTCDKCHCHQKSIFCHLKTSSLENLALKKILGQYKKGQTLFIQGNPSYGIYCIQKGKVKISKISNDGKEIIIKISGPGDVLGHQSLQAEDFHSTTATVLEEARVCFLDKAHLQALLPGDSQLSLNIIKKLSEEIKVFENTNAEMSHRNVRERLAKLLLDFKKSYGIFEQNKFRLDINLTREEMASMIGTANETIIRFISEFKEEGILEQQGKTIYIKNVNKLLETANL